MIIISFCFLLHVHVIIAGNSSVFCAIDISHNRALLTIHHEHCKRDYATHHFFFVGMYVGLQCSKNCVHWHFQFPSIHILYNAIHCAYQSVMFTISDFTSIMPYNNKYLNLCVFHDCSPVTELYSWVSITLACH